MERLIIVGLLVCAAPCLIAAEGPFVDEKRSFQRQKDAADDAAKIVAKGGAAAAQIPALLADASAQVRDRVVREIVEGWSDEDLASLAKGLQSKVSLVREGVAEIYGKRRFGPGAAALMLSLGRRGGEDATVVCLWALGEIDAAAAWKPVQSLFKKEKRSYRTKAAALATLAQLDAAKARPLIDDALDDKLPGVRIEALLRLAAIDPAAAIEGSTKLLGVKATKRNPWAPRLHFAAMDVLRGIENRAEHADGLRSAVDALIATLEDATGRGKVDLGATLADICHKRDLPAEAYAWESWWKANRDTWQPEAPAGGLEGRKPKTAVVEYYGVPVSSLRVTFLQDTSGGMGRNRQGEFDGEGPTRLDTAKEELARVLTKLDASAWVNLIAFASYYESCSPEPLPVKRGRKKLLGFNAALEIPKKPGHNRGNLYDTLVHAADNPHVDTIYLLTEGAPTEGKYLNYERFLEHFVHIHRHTRVRVHTLLMGRSAKRNRDFLTQLAEMTGGTFHEVE